MHHEGGSFETEGRSLELTCERIDDCAVTLQADKLYQREFEPGKHVSSTATRLQPLPVVCSVELCQLFRCCDIE